MPNLLPAPITEADLSEHLRSSDDFSFEMAVFHLCLRDAFNTWHGGTYQDPVTKKDRQFDIRTQLTKGLGTVKLAVECKNLKPNFPLLVSRIPRRDEEAFHEVIGVRNLPTTGGTTFPRYRLSNKQSVFPAGRYVGKATTQVGRNASGSKELVAQDTEAYDKWSQAIASCGDLVASAHGDLALTNADTAYTSIFPVLVVPDGALWVADYSARGVLIISPRQAKECTLYLGKNIPTVSHGRDYTISHLQIFTRTGFDGYLSRLSTDDDLWEHIFGKFARLPAARRKLPMKSSSRTKRKPATTGL